MVKQGKLGQRVKKCPFLSTLGGHAVLKPIFDRSACYRYNSEMSEKIQTKTGFIAIGFENSLPKGITDKNGHINKSLKSTVEWVGSSYSTLAVERPSVPNKGGGFSGSKSEIDHPRLMLSPSLSDTPLPPIGGNQRGVPSVRNYAEYVLHRKQIEALHRLQARGLKGQRGVEGWQATISPLLNRDLGLPVENFYFDYRTEEEILEHEQRMLLMDANLPELVNQYTNWLKDELILGFELTRKDGSISNRFMLAPKRGNRMYAYMMRERLHTFQSMLKTDVFFDARNKRATHRTPMVKFTLTYDRNLYSRFEAWQRVGGDLNRFTSWLRTKYDCKIRIIRSFEAHKDGYPHVNLDIILEGRFVVARYMPTKDPKKLRKGIYGAWRVIAPYSNKALSEGWQHGFVDVMAVSSVDGLFDFYDKDEQEPSKLSLMHDVKYLTKDLTKESKDAKNVLQSAILWKMRKRAYSFSIGKEGENLFALALLKLAERLDLKRMVTQTILRGEDPRNLSEVRFLGIFNRFDILIRRVDPPPDFMTFEFEGPIGGAD